MKEFFQRNWVHFAIVALFFVVVFFYFKPQFDGYGLKQHDIEMHKGMSREVVDYRERTGNETLWTNSMFGGMPTMQISLLYEGNYIGSAITKFVDAFPPPAGIVFLYMLGFYIFALCVGLNPWVGLFGAIAFGFSSYDIIIIQAGHNSKALAVAFMAPVLGAFIMAFQRNLKWGIILSALFMTMEISMNHLQVTYYLGILLIGVGIYLVYDAFKNKSWKQFFQAGIGVVAAYLVAVFINYGNISLTNDYAKHTIRGGNDLTLTPEGTSNKVNSTTGLDKDYVTQWSYGVGESFTLISPYVKGGGTVVLGDSPFAEDAENLDIAPSKLNAVMNYPVYWGDQPMTSGPVYVGVIVALLAFLTLIFVKNPIKWALLGVTALTLMLSWGKNFMGLTDFFLENIPGYNKFRAVTIILIVVELCLPVLAVFFLHYLIKERENFVQKKKQFLIAGASFFAFLLLVKVVGLGDNYLSEQDSKQFTQIEEAKSGLRENIRKQVLQLTPEQQQQYGINISDPAQLDQVIEAQYTKTIEQNPQFELNTDDIKMVREAIFQSSMNRTLMLTVLGLGLIALLIFTQLPSVYIIGALTLITFIDLYSVDTNYLGNQDDASGNGYKYWEEKGNTLFPMSTNAADLKILEIETSLNPSLKAKIAEGEKQGKAKADELGLSGKEKTRVIDSYKFAALNRNTNYRVFDVNGNFNSANASYFHKSLGGYHGAKLRNIQNLFEYHLSKNNNRVYDMLNVKYFIQTDDKGQSIASPNMTALGNVWLVKSIETYGSADDEIRALGNKFELKNLAQGALLVNGTVKPSASVFGSETVKYVLNKDTIDVRLSNGMSEGMEAVFVMDVNGSTNLVPKMTLELDTAKSFLKLVDIKVSNEFKHREEAVMLRSEAQGLRSKQFSGQGTIQMNKYEPNKIEYTADVNGNQFAVFSEIYYPEGWTAKIDGKEVVIKKVNYLLRGLEIPTGKHKIEFSFMLPKYEKSGTYAMIGSLIVFLLLGFGIYTELKKK